MRRPRVQWGSIRAILLVFAALTLVGLSEGCAMGASRDWVLFSEVHGTVLMHGKPVEGAELVEKAEISEHDDKNHVQHAVTDAAGAFHFPAIVRGRGLGRWFPVQPFVNQSIVIKYRGVDYMAWRHSKNTFEANTELDGQPLDFVCELTDKPGRTSTEYSGYYGICKPVASRGDTAD